MNTYTTHYKLEDLNAPELSVNILERIVIKIREGIERQVVTACEEIKLEMDFEWLQLWPNFSSPQFQHLCFRLCDAVYSLRIAVYDIDNRCVFIGGVDPEDHVALAEQNDLLPCIVSMDINALAEPYLVDARTEDPIDLRTTSELGNGIMSEWEINHYAVYHVLDILMRQGVTDIVYSDAPYIVPQIQFTKEGVHSYIYVSGHPNGLPPIPIVKSVCDVHQESKGYFADVPITFYLCNDLSFKDKVILRHGGYSNLMFMQPTKGPLFWMPIEEAMVEYGVIPEHSQG